MTKLNTSKTATAKAAAHVNGAPSADKLRAENAERMARIHAIMGEAAPMPSATHQLIATIGQLVAFSASIYWGVQLTGLLMTAAIVFTGSAFLAFVIGVTTAILAFKAAWSLGTNVSRFILDFDVNDATNVGHDLRIAAAKKVSLVKGWFKREDRIEVAPAR
jgi:hypothetical protein